MNIPNKFEFMPGNGNYVAAETAHAYDLSACRHHAYADIDPEAPFNLNGCMSFADQEIWKRLNATLERLAAGNRKSISLLDAGCGPGTWLRRLALRARELGFERVDAFGFDISPGMIELARAAVSHIDDQAVSMNFMVRDIISGHAFGNNEFDITICLYGVLNHVPAGARELVAAELRRVTSDTLFVTVRAAGSLPTIYIDSIDRATAFYQNHEADCMEIYLKDGSYVGFTSHLFTSGELRTLFQPHLSSTVLIGLDLFHSRFAASPQWNPGTLTDEEAFETELTDLERLFASNPHFIDRAAHILLIGDC